MRQKELWLFLFLVGMLALNWPFIAIFPSELPTYLFAVWLLLIAAIYIFVKNSAKDKDEP